MKVDERINIFYMVYSGTFLVVFPVPGDTNQKWVSSSGNKQFAVEEESLFVSGIFSMYYQEVVKAMESGDWASADEYLEYIQAFQHRYGADILPPESKVDLEIFYNEFNIFKRLSSYYGLIGFILVVLHFLSILNPKFHFNMIIKIASVIIIHITHRIG